MTHLHSIDFFQSTNLPEVSETFMDQSEELLSTVETRAALYNTENAKAPGPDGFNVEFFKRFGDKLLHVLLFLRNPLLRAKKKIRILLKSSTRCQTIKSI